jgi:hypothetical protein
MSSSPPLVLTTDFGTADAYVGVMKGVILGINPRANILDLTHQIQPQNLLQGAFLLGSSWRYFPQGTIHVGVVDPGVGTRRRPLLLVTPQARLVAPDNGLLSYVLRGFLAKPPEAPGMVAVPAPLVAYELTNPHYWLQPLSNTFHGRDLFAPVAAHLSLGVAPELMGQRVMEMVWLPAPQPQPVPQGVLGELIGEVIYVDHFGNLVTNISQEQVREVSARVTIKGRVIAGLSRTFAEPAAGSADGLLALLGSHGYLEVAVRNGNAAVTLGVGVGEPVAVSY